MNFEVIAQEVEDSCQWFYGELQYAGAIASYELPRRRLRSCLHGYIQGTLCGMGKARGLIPLPELMAEAGRKTRIDVAWMDNHGRLAAAFEVDGTIKRNSVAKLRALPASTVKIIVSCGLGERVLPTHLLENTTIQNINVTAAHLCILSQQ